MQVKKETSKIELRQDLECMMQKRIQKPSKGESTVFPVELLKPLYEYLYHYELSPKEQATLSFYEFQTLLLETALISPHIFKEIRKGYPGCSKLDTIINHILFMARSDSKYWLGKCSADQAEIAITSYQEYIDEVKCSKSAPAQSLSKETSESDHVQHRPTCETGTLFPTIGKLQVSPGTVSDLYQYLRAQLSHPVTDHMVQGLVLLFAQKHSSPNESECEMKIGRLRSRPEYELRKEKVVELQQCVSVGELWKHEELVALDFFLGQIVFFDDIKDKFI